MNSEEDADNEVIMDSPSKKNIDDTLDSFVVEKTKRQPKIPVVKPDQGLEVSNGIVNKYQMLGSLMRKRNENLI